MASAGFITVHMQLIEALRAAGAQRLEMERSPSQSIAKLTLDVESLRAEVQALRLEKASRVEQEAAASGIPNQLPPIPAAWNVM